MIVLLYINVYDFLLNNCLGSYNIRCHNALLAYNYGPQHLRNFHKKVTLVLVNIQNDIFLKKLNRNFKLQTRC